MEKILVADIMTRDPITISPQKTLLECAKQMVRKRVGSLLLVKNKKLVGFITRKDILWAIVKKRNLSQVKAIDISPRKIATIQPNTSVEEALKKMKKYRFEKLPVIQDKELQGIITTKDILNFQPELYGELTILSDIKEKSEKLKRIKKYSERKKFKEGICEECGNCDLLYRINGMLICESCKNSM